MIFEIAESKHLFSTISFGLNREKMNMNKGTFVYYAKSPLVYPVNKSLV